MYEKDLQKVLRSGRRLFVFNPWHEEAMAAACAFYTPTLTAQRVEREQREVMRRWMATGDLLLTDWREPQDWDGIDAIVPWGWDALLLRRLRRLGASERLLPSDRWVEEVRRLSSRETAVRLLALLRKEVNETVGESRLCRTEEEVREAVKTYGAAMLKAPWSCSGRGVFKVDASVLTSEGREGQMLWQRVRSIIHKQGAIAAERFCNKSQDFAMEFFYDGQRAHYRGLSLFETAPNGAYVRNIFGTEDELFALLTRAHTSSTITNLPSRTRTPLRDIYNNVCSALQRLLPNFLGKSYAGPLGIDMLLTAEGINPCVEINLRHTMGQAATLDPTKA